eukprot:Gb_13481 [translate_table: standard]
MGRMSSIFKYKSSRKVHRIPHLPPEEGQRYIDKTPFSEPEINRIYSKFCSMTGGVSEVVTTEQIVGMEEFRANPFALRICELFSEDGSGRLNFEKFVNIFSAFSVRTPAEVRMIWAFAIWDFDGDDLIGPGIVPPL